MCHKFQVVTNSKYIWFTQVWLYTDTLDKYDYNSCWSWVHREHLNCEYQPKQRQQFAFNYVTNVSIASHLQCFASAFKHGIQVYNVPFGAHYTQRIKTTQSWVLTDVSMATRHWMGRGEVRSVLCLEWLFRSRWLSHRSARNGDGGHLWKPPPPASTNTVQQTGWEHLHAL